MAERVGFEPTLPCGKHALQACALGRTTQPLQASAAKQAPPGKRYYTMILRFPLLDIYAKPMYDRSNFSSKFLYFDEEE